MIKSHSNQESGRQQFSAIDMLDQALGLPTPEGYAVITKEFARFLQGELERLYAIEDEFPVKPSVITKSSRGTEQ